MVEEQIPAGEQQTTKDMGLRRRGVIAAAWALVAGAVLKESVQPVAASTGMQIANTETGGVSNTVVGPSRIASTLAFSSTSAVLIADSSGTPLPGAPAAIHGTASAAVPAPEVCGVYGQGGNFTGVLGTSVGGGGRAAIHGVGSVGAVGVRGESASTNGVVGESASTNGVLGLIPETSAANAIAVCGVNSSTYVGATPGAGGFGVYGSSAKGPGVLGSASTAGAAAILGATNVAGAFAGAFFGPVVVTGSLQVLGAKSAAVRHPDGSHRLLYSVESPESWFEDFGEAELVDGKVEVKIDPDFGAVAHTEKYHVFLTEYDDHHALYVTKRTANGFAVHAKSGAGNGRFSWRVVAKRRDISGDRLAIVSLPAQPDCPSPADTLPPPQTDHGPRSRHR